MGFFEWLAEPFLDGIIKENTEISENKEDRRIILPSKKIYRPETFEDYIGQRKAKDIISSYIAGTQKRNIVFPHTIIHGSAGTGKTTLARLIAIYLGVDYTCAIGSDIKEYTDIIRRIETVNGGIVFIDEIHGVQRDIAEKMYPVMEDFKDCSQQFTLIGATTELGEIIKDRKPLFDRFKIIIELEKYTVEDLVRMASLYKNKMFDNEDIKNNHYILLAKNCRGTPRTLVRLLESLVYLDGNIDRVLRNFSILKEGFTETDLRILEYIKQNEKGVGLSSIANYMDTSQENYLHYIEPYLLQSSVIIRTSRGRRITDRGLKLIEDLKNAY